MRDEEFDSVVERSAEDAPAGPVAPEQVSGNPGTHDRRQGIRYVGLDPNDPEGAARAIQEMVRANREGDPPA